MNPGQPPIACTIPSEHLECPTKLSPARRRSGRVDPGADGEDATGEIRKLTSLVEISQALSGSPKLAESLPAVLDTLERHHSVVRAWVTLADDESGEQYVTAATGGVSAAGPGPGG